MQKTSTFFNLLQIISCSNSLLHVITCDAYNEETVFILSLHFLPILYFVPGVQSEF